MKTVLIYTSPARGHLYPMIDVALELNKQGCRVILQTLADEKENIEQLGLTHRAISAGIESLTLEDYRASHPLAQLQATFRCWLSRARHEIEDLRICVNEYKPDLLIVDANTWGASAFAEAQGTPWAMFLPYCLPVPSADTPAFGPGFAPPVHGLHRLRDRAVNAITRHAVHKMVAGLNEIRSHLGIPPLRRFDQLFERPDVILYRTATPFDYPRKRWPKNIVPIGPGLWAPTAAAPEDLVNLPAPRILVSVSTEMQDDRAIIDTALRALADENASLIVTTAALDPGSFRAPHRNVHIAKFLPHAQVIPNVDLLITHGGMGSVQRALASGVPVCVIPWGRDQNETARRVEYSASGVMLRKGKLNPQRLREAVHEAMQCKPGAEKIAHAFQQAGGAERAATEIFSLLG
jgi:MGT family glycosyltransferase